jgi:hypothetical protein
MKLMLVVIFLLPVVILGCVNPNKQVLATGQSQLQLRNIQSRSFDTTDKEKTLRTVIATLQDLEFVIDKADGTLGIVSATKLGGTTMRMNVSVQPKGSTQLRVRANAQLDLQAVEEALPYQQFFQALEKAMFLTANWDE